eukprot:scaffold2047_cov119-Isochrysis_galbana.AAC.5
MGRQGWAYVACHRCGCGRVPELNARHPTRATRPCKMLRLGLPYYRKASCQVPAPQCAIHVAAVPVPAQWPSARRHGASALPI